MGTSAAFVLHLITLLAAFSTLVTTVSADTTTTAFPCGGDFEGTKGTITSPNYPNDYPANVDCQWTLTSPDNTVITVHFEYIHTYNSNDYLQIRDGNDSNAPLLETCSGSSSCSVVTSTSNSLFLYFHSDSSYQYKGFFLNWFAGLAVNKYCYYCDNNPDSNHYDPICGEDNYQGHDDNSDQWFTCYTNVHYDGTHRVERGGTETFEEEGNCYDSGFSISCFCQHHRCNNNLCQNCTTTMPPPTTATTHSSITTTQHPITSTQPVITTTHPHITSSQPPATTTQPPTSNQPSTQSGPLQCYSCIGCNIINGDTNVESSVEFLSCYTAIELGNSHFVIRGGSRDYEEDGTCYHEADGVFVCYCTSDKCNDDPAAQLLETNIYEG